MKMANYGLIILLMIFGLFGCADKKTETYETAKVERGSIRAQISATGIVQPRNRLEIKPPISGRIDQVLVKEGAAVRKGETLAWMSSSDRAALLDAARSKGAEELKYWEDVYKPTAVIAPLNGTIIQRGVEPGQSVTTGDPVLVMADYLIVMARVDETDIGRIKAGQKVNIELDAYQGDVIPGKVEQIAYESKTISNVNIYEVNILPESVPSFFRAGMSATVSFILEERVGILLLPISAVKKIGQQSYVFTRKADADKPEAMQIKPGLENSAHVEVVSGLSEGDEIVIPTIKMIEELTKKFERQRGPVNPFQRRDN